MILVGFELDYSIKITQEKRMIRQQILGEENS
jgi:hypothetical protein